MTRATFRRDDESPTEYAERLERCEAQAGWYFAGATKPQTAAYNRAMADLRGLSAPKYDRAREAAKAVFTASTKAASELCDLTLAELMTAGEVSEELSYRWDELALTDVVAREMADA
jgi:hypothetical protein